jgi:hypothetical protein
MSQTLSSHLKKTKNSKKQWNAIAKHDLVLEPESIATVTTIPRGVPNRESMYLKAVPLKRGSNSFISALHGIINLDKDDLFVVQVPNTTKQQVLLHAGNLLGFLTQASHTLKSTQDLMDTELKQFRGQVAQLTILMPGLDALSEPIQNKIAWEPIETAELQDTEHLGWGPKPTDPGPDCIYPSDKL